MSKDFKGLTLIAITLWLLFGGGFRTVSGIFSSGEGPSVTDTIIRGAQIALPTAKVIISRPAAATAVPLPARAEPQVIMGSLVATQEAPIPIDTMNGPTVTPAPAVEEEASVAEPAGLPEPGQSGFVESFKQPPACSPFIGYITGPCARRPGQSTQLPEPGEEGFVESFK